MEQLKTQKPLGGLTQNALRTWGLLFLLGGAVGRSVLQNRLLHLGAVSSLELLEAMQTSRTAMLYATLSLILQAVETCAVPIFAFLLAEGVQHTASLRRYALRVLGAALLAELPYHLAWDGAQLRLSSRNPMFGLVICLVMVWFYRRFAQKTAAHLLLRGLVTLAAVLWCGMLSIRYGSSTVVLFAALWAFRDRPTYRGVAGAAAAMLCCAFSLFFLAAPMGFLPVHLYNGEKGPENRLVNYLAYPVLLLAVGAAGRWLP